MKKLALAIAILTINTAIADELNIQVYGDTDYEANLNITYRHPITDTLHVGIVDNGVGMGLSYQADSWRALGEFGYDLFNRGIVGNINLGDKFVASREHVAENIWLVSTTATTDFEITENITVVPVVRGGWYTDDNTSIMVKVLTSYVINDDWLVRGDVGYRGWKFKAPDYYSPETNWRGAVVPMYRWNGMQLGIGPLVNYDAVPDYSSLSYGARAEFRFKNPAIRIVADYTSEYSGVYAYFHVNF